MNCSHCSAVDCQVLARGPAALAAMVGVVGAAVAPGCARRRCNARDTGAGVTTGVCGARSQAAAVGQRVATDSRRVSEGRQMRITIRGVNYAPEELYDQ